MSLEPWALRLSKVFLFVTPMVSKSAPGGELRMVGKSEISAWLSNNFEYMGDL